MSTGLDPLLSGPTGNGAAAVAAAAPPPTHTDSL